MPLAPILRRRPRTHARARLRRGRLALALAAAPALAALLAVGATPRAAHADAYGDCLDAVDALVNGCLGIDPTWSQSFGCKWAGGMGYFACAAGETIKKIAESFPNQL